MANCDAKLTKESILARNFHLAFLSYFYAYEFEFVDNFKLSDESQQPRAEHTLTLYTTVLQVEANEYYMYCVSVCVTDVKRSKIDKVTSFTRQCTVHNGINTQ